MKPSNLHYTVGYIIAQECGCTVAWNRETHGLDIAKDKIAQ